MKIYARSALISTLILLSFISLIPGTSPLIDDLVSMIFGLIWISNFLYCPKEKSIARDTFLMICAICGIALLSNVCSQINGSYIQILSDMFSFLKMFFVFWGTYALIHQRPMVQRRVLKSLTFFSKIFIVVGFVFSILNLLGIVSMYDSVRFGVKNYYFIYGNASQYGVLVGVALSFILQYSSKNTLIYEILAIVTMILTVKGMALIIVAVYVLLNLLNRAELKVWQVLSIGVVLIFLLRYQIAHYLLDATAPRAILLRYGVITATEYFPLGAGFGTYGSNIAAKYYSPLYIKYGFQARKSLQYNNDGLTALNDVYLGMAFGQFGFLGTVLLLTVFVYIGLWLLKMRTSNRKAKKMCMALFACLCGMVVMAGSIKGVPGQLMLFTIQMFFEANCHSKEINRQ